METNRTKHLGEKSKYKGYEYFFLLNSSGDVYGALNQSAVTLWYTSQFVRQSLYVT